MSAKSQDRGAKMPLPMAGALAVHYLLGERSPRRREGDALSARTTSVSAVLLDDRHRGVPGPAQAIVLLDRFSTELESCNLEYESFGRLIHFCIDNLILPHGADPDGGNEHYCVRMSIGAGMFHVATRCAYARRENRFYSTADKSIISTAARTMTAIIDNEQEKNSDNPKKDQDQGAILTIPMPLGDGTESIIQFTTCYFRAVPTPGRNGPTAPAVVFDEYHLVLLGQLHKMAVHHHLICQLRAQKRVNAQHIGRWSFDGEAVSLFTRLLDEFGSPFRAWLVPGAGDRFSTSPVSLPTINSEGGAQYPPVAGVVLQAASNFPQAASITVYKDSGVLWLTVDEWLAPYPVPAAGQFVAPWGDEVYALVIAIRRGSERVGYLWIERDGRPWEIDEGRRLARAIDHGYESLPPADSSDEHQLTPLPPTGVSEAGRRLDNFLDLYARQPWHPVLLWSERGCGKRHYAQSLHRKTFGNSLNIEFVGKDCDPHALPPLLDPTRVRKDKLRGTVVLYRPDTFPDELLAAVQRQWTYLLTVRREQFSRPGTEGVSRGDEPPPAGVRLLAVCEASDNPCLSVTPTGTPAAREFLSRVFASRGGDYRVPPLRERRDDIKHIVQYWFTSACFAREYPRHKLDERVFDALSRHDWQPENLIALRGVVESMCVLAGSTAPGSDLEIVVTPDHLPPHLAAETVGHRPHTVTRVAREELRKRQYRQIKELKDVQGMSFEKIRMRLAELDSSGRLTTSQVKRIYYTAGESQSQAEPLSAPKPPGRRRGGKS